MSTVARAGLLIALLASAVGCTEGTLTFGGGRLNEENDDIIVRGDIDDIFLVGSTGSIVAPPAGRDIVVFVYTDLRCCNAAFVPATDLPFRLVDFSTPPYDVVEASDLVFEDVEAVIVADGSDTFTIGDITRGDLTVVLLLDEAEPDGQIDAGDPTAVVEDSDERLVDVRPGRSVEIQRADVTFDRDFPEGAATPDDIRVTAGEAP